MGKGSGTCDRPAMAMSASGGYTAAQLCDYFSIEAKPSMTSWTAADGRIKLSREFVNFVLEKGDVEQKWVMVVYAYGSECTAADRQRLQDIQQQHYDTFAAAQEAMNEVGNILNVAVRPIIRRNASYRINPGRWSICNQSGEWYARHLAAHSITTDYQRMSLYSGDNSDECMDDYNALTKMRFNTRQAAYDNLIAWLEYVGYNPES